MTQSTGADTKGADLPVESLRASPFEMFSTLMVKRLAFGGFGDEAWIPAPAHGWLICAPRPSGATRAAQTRASDAGRTVGMV